ncbi:MAG: arylesterase [Roseiarcus sp.]
MKRFLRPENASYGHLRIRVQALALALAAALSLAAAPAEARLLHIVALGDSLTAGYGLPPGEAFPDALARALKARGWDVEVANAGVSGDTAADGLARFDWSVPAGADALIVELGANDMLRGMDPSAAETALALILEKARAAHIATLLTGMRAPPNLGPDYQRRFDAIYPDLAKNYGVPLYPFFLGGVAGDPKLNQSDGLHPTREGVEKIVAAILPSVEGVLAEVKP